MTWLTFFEKFTFIRPDYLWLMPIIIILFITLHRIIKHKTDWDNIIDVDLQIYLLNQHEQKIRGINTWPITAACLACLFACACLAGPSWEKISSPVKKNSHAMVIIADLTLSMHTTDITPSRLVRMRYKILELLKQNKDRQVALIAYSGDAHIVTPLTDDVNNIRALVPALTPEIMPSIGSDALAAFDLAEQVLKSSAATKTTLVWLTDEVLESQTKAIIKNINRQDAQLFIIGVGTEQGGPVVLPSGKFVKTGSGRIVNAPMSRERLMSLSVKTNGQYFDLQSNNSDVESIINHSKNLLVNGVSDVADNTDKDRIVDQQLDRGAYFAIALLPFVLLSFRRGWILCLLLSIHLIVPEPAWAETDGDGKSLASSMSQKWQNLWQTNDQQGKELFKHKSFSDAANRFDRYDWKGISSLQAKHYDSAIEELNHAIASIEKSPGRLADLHYNLGHSYAHSNDFENAIKAYDEALLLNPELLQAKKAKALLEALQKQQQQEKKQQDESNDADNSQGNNAQSPNADADADADADSQGSSMSENSKQQPTDNTAQANKQSDQLLDQQAKRASEQREPNTPNKDAQQAQKQSDQDPLEENASNEIMTQQRLDQQRQAELEQWLQKIPDDPGGLLRRKFDYQRQLNERQGKYLDNNEEGQLW